MEYDIHVLNQLSLKDDNGNPLYITLDTIDYFLTKVEKILILSDIELYKENVFCGKVVKCHKEHPEYELYSRLYFNMDHFKYFECRWNDIGYIYPEYINVDATSIEHVVKYNIKTDIIDDVATELTFKVDDNNLDVLFNIMNALPELFKINPHLLKTEFTKLYSKVKLNGKIRDSLDEPNNDNINKIYDALNKVQYLVGDVDTKPKGRKTFVEAYRYTTDKLGFPEGFIQGLNSSENNYKRKNFNKKLNKR